MGWGYIPISLFSAPIMASDSEFQRHFRAGLSIGIPGTGVAGQAVLTKNITVGLVGLVGAYGHINFTFNSPVGFYLVAGTYSYKNVSLNRFGLGYLWEIKQVTFNIELGDNDITRSSETIADGYYGFPLIFGVMYSFK